MAPPTAARVLCALVLVAAVRPAAADRFRAEAERRNRNGNRHYASGRFDSALQSYQSAYDMVPDPKYLYNIGLAKEKMFDYEGCALAFQKFLDQTEGDGKTEAEIRAAATTRRDICSQRTTVPVRITSVPTNSKILLGDPERGDPRGRTPQTVALPLGRHTVTVSAAGYVTQSQTLTVEIGERPQLDFVLEKLSSLRVEVDPAGARVRIDDSDWLNAPARRQVRAGTHEVVVAKDGYHRSRRQVNVEPGQEVSVVLSLRPLPTVRALRVDESSGAARVRVRVDDRHEGPVPYELRLPPGEHRLRVTGAGRIPYASAITIAEDRDLHLEVELRPGRSRRERVVLWGLAGGAATAGIVGLVYGGLTLSDQLRFRDDPTNLGLHERGERRARNTDLWLGGAAVLAAGTVLWYYLSRPTPSTARVIE